MISHEHKLIFIHLPKCGGTSIEVALTGRSWHHPDLRGEQHLTADETRRQYGDGIFNSYFKCAVVRNTWDLLVAFYLWGTTGLRGWNIPGFPWGREWGHPFDSKRRWLARKPTFAEYLADVPRFNDRLHFSRSHRDLTRQRESLSIDGKLAVDEVLRFDDLPNEFARLCERRGIPRSELPHKLRSGRTRHYSSFYNEELRDLVRSRYAEDIEAFGFEFERG